MYKPNNPNVLLMLSVEYFTSKFVLPYSLYRLQQDSSHFKGARF